MSKSGVKFPAQPAIDPGQEDYETKGHLSTLMDAEKIKSDPTKMAKVAKLAGAQHKILKKLKKPVRSTDDLKKAGDNLHKKGSSGFGEPDADDA